MADTNSAQLTVFDHKVLHSQGKYPESQGKTNESISILKLNRNTGGSTPQTDKIPRSQVNAS